MRTATLFPLAVAMIAIPGCGPEVKEETALGVPERDLTLVTAAPEVEIASPVELQRPEVSQARRGSRPTAKPAAVPRRPKAKSKPFPATADAPALVPATRAPVSRFAGRESEPVNDRELPPGKTVTVIPASTGPSTGDGDGDFSNCRRGMGGGSGMGGPGRWPGRPGPGIGIAIRPRPTLY
jgi:hypothetical protein